ncbi:MAG: helix-turn-helix transcriptional regulator, partial [Gemmatimonadota bacterium]
MPTSPLRLDCLPLDFPPTETLSHEQLRSAESLQRVLLSPHDYSGIDAWRAAVNTEASAATGADAAMFQLMLPGIEPHYSQDICMTRLEEYSEYLPSFDRQRGIFQRAMALGAGNRYMLWLDHIEWLYGSAYFNEWITELRAFDTLFAAVPSSGSPYPAMLHVYHDHPYRGTRFDGRAVRLMQLVRPALEAGVRAAERSLANRAAFIASLDTRRDGALVFDPQGKLLYRNPAFAEIVPLDKDRAMTVDVGRTMATGLFSEDERIRFDPTTARQAIPAGLDVLLMTAVLIGEGVFDVNPVALVTLHANEAAPADGSVLRDRFDLTPRQAEVARLLARRLSNTEIAERLRVSPNTARNHTEAVMGKLDVRDRRDVEHKIRD